MPIRRAILAFGSGLALCTAMPTVAQEGDLFARLDRNGDGILSSQELETDVARRGNWIAVDRDRDGRIQRREFGTVASAPDRSRSAAGATAPGAPQQQKSATGSGRP